MKHPARITALSCLTVFAVSCSTDEPTAPSWTPALSHRHDDDPCRAPRDQHGSREDAIVFRCAIAIPSPLTGSQKGWVEESNAKYFLSDASANGVQVINIRTHTYVGLIGGMAGAATTGGGTATTNGPGPNSFVSVPAPGGRWGGNGRDDDDRHHGRNRVLFVSDGNSTVHVIDMDDLEIIRSVSTAARAGTGIPDAQVCDDGTAHYCGRANEIAYDPVHH